MKRWMVFGGLAGLLLLAAWALRASLEDSDDPPSALPSSPAAPLRQLPRPREALPTPSEPAVGGHRVHVTVLEKETSTPLAQAKVRWVTSEGAVLGEWTTDAQGVVDVNVEFPAALEAAGEGYVWSPRASLSGETSEVTLRCPRGVMIEGLVVDRQGAPITRVEVTADNEQPRPEHSVRTVSTDATGHFRTWVLAGKVLLRAGGELWAYSELHLTTPVSPLRIELSAGSGLRGQVFRADGAPAARAKLRLSGVEVGEADGAGRFEFDGLSESELSLDAVVAPLRERSQLAVVRLQPGAWSEVTLQLEPAMTIEGSVVDEQGQPVAGASLGLRGTTPGAPAMADTPMGTTDERGEFVLTPLEIDPRAFFELGAWKGHARGVTQVHLDERVRLVLKAQPGVSGAVIELDGGVLDEFEIEFETDGKHLATVETHTGHFWIARHRLGSSLTIKARRHLPWTFTLPGSSVDLGTIALEPEPDPPVVAGERQPVHLKVLVGGTSASEVAADGHPLERDEEGFLVERAAPDQRVWINGEDFAPMQVTLGPGTTIEVEGQPGGTLRLTDANEDHTIICFDRCVPSIGRFCRTAVRVAGMLELRNLPGARCVPMVNAVKEAEAIDLPPTGIAQTTLVLINPDRASSQVLELPNPRRRK